MDFNFFQWLRDGVRQSVLLGVSDAVEQIGAPDTSAEIHPDVAALLNPTTNQAGGSKRRKVGTTGGRKRLGKSLQEMNSSDKS